MIWRQVSCAFRMNGVSSISAPELASVSSIVFDSISRCASRFCGGQQLAAVVARVAGEVGKARLHAVDAGLDHAGRVGDALGLAIDHADDLADFADRVADRAETATARRGCARRRS